MLVSDRVIRQLITTLKAEVLILVLVDVGLGLVRLPWNNIRLIRVLILVLVDVGLGQIRLNS